jgi:hypothetical protein
MAALTVSGFKGVSFQLASSWYVEFLAGSIVLLLTRDVMILFLILRDELAFDLIQSHRLLLVRWPLKQDRRRQLFLVSYRERRPELSRPV